jgi:hypothetical protein
MKKPLLNVIADTGLTSVRNLNLALRWSLYESSASIRPRRRVQVAYRMRALGPERGKPILTLGVPGDLRAQGSEMPATLARLLVLVFALSYGCGMLRGLIWRRRGARREAWVSGRSKPTHAGASRDSVVAASESERSPDGCSLKCCGRTSGQMRPMYKGWCDLSCDRRIVS